MEIKVKEIEHHVSPVGFWQPFDFWDCNGSVNGRKFDAVYDTTDDRLTIPRGGKLGLTVDEQRELVAIVRGKFEEAREGAETIS